jgi:ABC-type lipoprotein export system ATPase subunit
MIRDASELVLVQSVSKTYGRAPGRIDALRDVSLTVGQGQFARVAGLSGSGKTTLLNLIAALDRPDRGEIIVAGTQISRLSVGDAAAYRRNYVGIVFDGTLTFDDPAVADEAILPFYTNLAFSDGGRQRRAKPRRLVLCSAANSNLGNYI